MWWNVLQQISVMGQVIYVSYIQFNKNVFIQWDTQTLTLISLSIYINLYEFL